MHCLIWRHLCPINFSQAYIKQITFRISLQTSLISTLETIPPLSMKMSTPSRPVSSITLLCNDVIADLLSISIICSTTHATVLRPLPSWISSETTRVSRHQKGKTNLDLLEQEIVSGSGISWAICKSAPWPRCITTPASHHSVFYRPDGLPAPPTCGQRILIKGHIARADFSWGKT